MIWSTHENGQKTNGILAAVQMWKFSFLSLCMFWIWRVLSHSNSANLSMRKKALAMFLASQQEWSQTGSQWEDFQKTLPPLSQINTESLVFVQQSAHPPSNKKKYGTDSVANIHYKPGGGNVKIFSEKVTVKNVTPRTDCKPSPRRPPVSSPRSCEYPSLYIWIQLCVCLLFLHGIWSWRKAAFCKGPFVMVETLPVHIDDASPEVSCWIVAEQQIPRNLTVTTWIGPSLNTREMNNFTFTERFR